ncbi:SusC/RagA family TonB-linked outer membrane protein [Mucilaginibacter sp. X4EP1]|uniref:SusC/RagA family TonB-linked outer membrane protein n=1 Tax=Mucilaginibacter sp. X4EP1 TaxID=2723092 RepID=UPI002166E81E|nr:TonB-dependent receptor [Mucilaginibacter sp. X4EP1]MCS3816480.1 TonB-linked SusC/RagA family outer membrane protein [Mucilaginibacter sp. X4EP1]
MGKILRMALLFISLAMCFTVMAQTPGTVIKGTVTDDKGVTLPGVTVTVKGTTVGALTDVNGAYTLTVPSTSNILVFRFIGMETQEVAIGTKTIINVGLKLSSTELTDVVVIGYGTQKRGDINSAISSVSAKDIENVPQASVDQMLQGRAAGVTVTQNSGGPGSATSVHIRGISSFTTSEPLYVIDGVAIQGGQGNGYTGSGQQPGAQLNTIGGAPNSETAVSPLAQLNPNDIESIDILKDAAATAIYGSRASNGVILITTKKGKNGTSKVDYDFWYGVQKQGKFLDMMNLQQYAVLQNSLADDFGVGRRTEFANPSILGPGTNWQAAIFQNAPEQSHSLSFSGARDGNDYYISAGYLDQDGTIIGYHFNRYTLSANINSQVKPWLRVGTSIAANQSNENIGLGNASGLVYNALLAAPDAAVYNADGSFAAPYTPPGGLPEGGPNPVQQGLNITNTVNRSNIHGNLYGDIKFTKDLTLHSEIDGNFDWSKAKAFEPTYSYGATGSTPAFENQQAALQEYDASDNYWNWVEHLDYNHTFGTKNVLSVLVGHEVWESTYDGINATTKGFTAGNTLQTLNLGTQTADNLGEPTGSTSMESFLARVNYTYDNKYSISASGRSDKSSEFAEGHQTGYFPGVAVSWRISQEPFMAGLNKTISNLKLRVGYGEVGNSNVPQYSYGSAIIPVTTGLGTGFSFGNFSNPNLTWETDIQKNIGLDFSLLNNRIDVTVDAFDKTSKNFLFQPPATPAFLGGGTAEYSQAAVVQEAVRNAGEIENKGIEFTINTRNIQAKDFTWSSTLIFSHYANKVISLDGFPPIVEQIGSGGGSLITVNRTAVGGPLGEFYGYKVQGIVSSQAQLDYLAAHPQNVVGVPSVITSDKTVANGLYLGDIQYQGNNNGAPNTQYNLGNPNPDFTYSIGNNFTYKGFDLSIFLTGQYGGKILNALEFQTEGLDGLYSNQTAAAANYWTPTNQNTNIPSPRATFGNNNLVMSDRFLESASFLRLQNVRFGYNLPAKWAKVVMMNHLKVFVSGQNLYVFTKYNGLDPEVGFANQNVLLQNIDNGRYPIPRVVTFGLNAEF